MKILGPFSLHNCESQFLIIKSLPLSLCVWAHAHTHTYTHPPTGPVFSGEPWLMHELCSCSRRTLVSTFQILWCGVFLALKSSGCVSFHPLSGLAFRRGKRGWGSRGQEVPHPLVPQPLQVTSKSLEPPYFRLLPGELSGFNFQSTVDHLENEVLFCGTKTSIGQHG